MVPDWSKAVLSGGGTGTVRPDGPVRCRVVRDRGAYFFLILSNKHSIMAER